MGTGNLRIAALLTYATKAGVSRTQVPKGSPSRGKALNPMSRRVCHDWLLVSTSKVTGGPKPQPPKPIVGLDLWYPLWPQYCS